VLQDTLINPPSYKNSFIITNPPFLSKARSNNKLIFEKYKANNLYKCFLISIVEGDCLGGILILPANF